MESRRVLIVSTTFFPDPMVASVRVTNWCRMLPQRGWQPNVLCRWYGHAATDAILAEQVHSSVRVGYLNGPCAGIPGRVQIQEQPRAVSSCGQRTPLRQRAIQKLKGWIGNASAGQIATLDMAEPFWRRASKDVVEAARALQPSVVLTTSPAHTNHLPGLRIARELGIPWVADFRDGYLMEPRYKPQGIARLAWLRHSRYEAAIYREASSILHAIPLQARWAQMRYPEAREKIRILRHPCPRDLAEGLVDPDRSPAGRRSVRMIGFIGDREARVLARAVAALVAEGEDIELRFVGKPPASLDAIRGVLGDRVIATGFLRHDMAKQQMAGADVLVSFLSPERSTANLVTSKLFEFAAARKPIVHLNPTAPDKELLRRLRFAKASVDPSVDDLQQLLRWGLSNEGNAVAQSPEAAEFVQAYSWEQHADRLVDALDTVARKG